MTASPALTAADWAGRSEEDLAIEARILREYDELPGLLLTIPQAARLFCLDITRCARLFEDLVLDGALCTDGHAFFLAKNVPLRVRGQFLPHSL